MRALVFLKLVDVHDGNLSLTNLAMWTCVVKLAMTPNPSLADIGALLLSLLAYSGKKIINRSAAA